MRIGVVVLVVALIWFFGFESRRSGTQGPGARGMGTRGGGRYSGSSVGHRGGRADHLPLRFGGLLIGHQASLWIRLSSLRKLAIADEHSLLVVGPTRSGKTTRVVIPNLSTFDGSVIATSVKTDLLSPEVLEAAHRRGPIIVLGDPERATHQWHPIYEATDRHRAAAMAHAIVLVQPSISMTSGDTQFWYQLAEPIMAAMLAASSLTGRDLLAWLDDPARLYAVLNEHGETALADAVLATSALEDRQRDSVFVSARGLLAPLRELDPQRRPVNIGELLVEEPHSVFLVASPAQQEFLSLLFALLLSRIVAGALERERRAPLLLCLDELANLAPIPNLDRLAAVGVGQGVRLISIVQDLSQLDARYGMSANSIINNHASKLFLSPTSDPNTRRYLRDLDESTLHSRYPLLQEGSTSLARLYTHLQTRA